MRLAITCNGPGETAGWLLPLLHALNEAAPDAATAVFFVPDDYATGAEADVVARCAPHVRTIERARYLRFALGATLPDVPAQVDAVLYLGGDLLHAARVQRRLGGALLTYKFSRPRYARRTARAFAVDAANAADLQRAGVDPARVRQVGNLAIDGALLQAQRGPEVGVPRDGVLFMPGSRAAEIAQLVPFFLTTALRMRRERPDLPIAFGIAPFTGDAALARALEAGGDRRFYARRGQLLRENDRTFIANEDGTVRFPVLHEALAGAKAARLAVTIPGTKVIELASLGVPVLACTPYNAPELAAINGPLTYLDRIPVAGPRLKRAAVLHYARRFRYHTQPNIDAQRAIVDELHGTLTPGRVARAAIERYDDTAWLARAAADGAELYREHRGAAARMAEEIIACASPS